MRSSKNIQKVNSKGNKQSLLKSSDYRNIERWKMAVLIWKRSRCWENEKLRDLKNNIIEWGRHKDIFLSKKWRRNQSKKTNFFCSTKRLLQSCQKTLVHKHYLEQVCLTRSRLLYFWSTLEYLIICKVVKGARAVFEDHNDDPIC